MPHGDSGSEASDGGRQRPLADIYAGLLSRLEGEVLRRVTYRRLVEQRWLQDIQQFEGRDDDTSSPNSSPTTARRPWSTSRGPSATLSSRSSTTCSFPTDDKNWAVAPTPVPEVDKEVRGLQGDIDVLTAGANVELDDAVSEHMRGQADELAMALSGLETERQEARQKADLMSAEIEDNLDETEYAIHCRNVIHDATIAGTGILKGPIPLSERVRKNWLMEDGGKWRLQFDPDSPDRFAYQHVSYWHIYPDTAARRPGMVESWLERHLLRRRDLIELAKQPGVDADAVREILKEGPQDRLPQHIIDLDAVIEEENMTFGDEIFVMWEYRGPLEEDEMQAVMSQMMEEGGSEGETEDGQATAMEIDPLLQMDGVIYFCQGHMPKVGINALDDNAPIYSIFQVEKSEARFWTVGIPHIMRAQSNTINDAWRAMLDNAEHAAFPQTEVDTSVVQRAGGGENKIEPRGVWERLSGAGDKRGLYFHDVPIHQEHYQAIIELALRFIDIETNISVIASGEQGAATTRTAGGMALLMNATNVVFRRVVKNFDDGIITPSITRAYYFLMQFSEKEAIKGDYAVKARGSQRLAGPRGAGAEPSATGQSGAREPVAGGVLQDPRASEENAGIHDDCLGRRAQNDAGTRGGRRRRGRGRAECTA